MAPARGRYRLLVSLVEETTLSRRFRRKEQNPGGEASTRTSLRDRAASGAFWTLGGQGGLAALRLASNLILTRLLFPEAFGYMALVNVAVLAGEMFSDLGFRGSVVSNPRANEKRFLDTVWTVKVLRGFLVSGILVLAAPAIAAGFEQPIVAGLLAVTALRIGIFGCASTSLLTLVREVQPKRHVLLMVGSQAIGTLAMIVLAFYFKSVWVLVVGDLISALTRAIGSHFIVPGYRNSFAWDRSAVSAVFGFGRWIWVSSAMTYLLSQGDRAVLGTLMDAGELGVYSIAFALCSMIVGTAQQMSGNLLFPVFSELAREGGENAISRIRKTRGLALVAFFPLLSFFIAAGPWLVDLLYDDRYSEAGWMLQLLAAGALPHVLVVSAERGLLAFGDSFRHMMLQVISASFFLVGLAVGATLGGSVGLMIGAGVARVMAYPAYAMLGRKYGFVTPGLDLLALFMAAGVGALGYYLLGTPA